MPQVYNPILGRHQDVSEADAQYLSRPLAGDRSGTRMLKNPLDGKYYPVSEEEFQFLSTPGKTLADTHQPAMAAPPPDDEGVGLADYGKAIMAGGASVGQGFGWLTKQLGGETIGSAIEELGRNAVDYWTDSLSDAAKDALSREFVRKNEMGEWEWGDASLHTVGLMGAQSLLGTAAGVGAGAGISSVLRLFANPFGRSVLAAAARTGSIQAAKKLRLVDRVIGAVGFGVAEGLVSGSSVGASVEEAVRRLPPEKLLENPRYQQVFNSTDERMSELERHQYATDVVAKEASSEAGWQSGLLTGLLGAPMGAFFGPLVNRSGRLASNRLASAAVGATGEAAQESLQSAGEAAIEVTTRQRYGEQDLDALEAALNAVLGGAAAGGALGGAIGAVDFRPERADVPRGTKPDTATPLKNAAMRAAQAGVPRDLVEAEVVASDRPIVDRIQKLNALAVQAASLPEPEPAPTYGEAIAAREGEPAPAPKVRVKPTPLDVVTPIDEAAHRAATSPLNPTPPPTPEQIEADNYEAGRIKGADVGLRSIPYLAVEYPRGVERNGVVMRHHYGRIPGVVGGDGMSLDFFMGNEDTDTVYLYHHIDKAGRFAQHKALLNMSRDEAEATLGEFYHDPSKGPRGKIVELSKPEFEQWVATGNTAAPHPKSELAAAPHRYEGPPTRVVTPGGDAVPAKYALVELGDLVSRHTLTGRANARFPQALQPRDRSRAGLRQWIIETAARFEPALSVEGVSAGEGAPVVGPDGVIESGNGRMMLITKLYLDKDSRYRDYLKANAAKFGFTPEQVDSLARPVLVRERTEPMDMAARQRFTVEANRPTLSTFSASEQAKADARGLTDQQLSVFSPGSDGNVLADSNRMFVASFLSNLPATERAGLLTADGAPTRQLANRIQAAIFAKAYQDDRLLTLMAEEANPDVRNILSALTAAAPAFARARAQGILDQADVVTPLIGAIEVVRQARNKGQSTAEYLGQQGLFGDTPAEVDRMARFIDANLRSAKKMGEAFTAMASFLETEGQRRTSGSLFGEEAPLDVGLAMQAANQRMQAQYGGGGQAVLFSRQMVATASPAMFSRHAFVQTQRGWQIAEIYQHAVPNQSRLDGAAQEIAAALGIEWVNPGIKSRARLEEKIEKEGYAGPGEVVDVVRGAFLTDEPALSEEVLTQLRGRFEVLDKDIQAQPSGYIDRKLLVRFPGGQVGEVQIKSRAMFEAAKGRGRALYKAQRELLQPNGEIADPERYEQLRLEQLDLYARALLGSGWEAVASWELSQALKSLRQAASVSSAPELSTSAGPTLTQAAPGEGMTNAASEPESVNPTTAGRSSKSTKRLTEASGSASTDPSVAHTERVRQWLAPDLEALRPIIQAEVVATTAELPDPTAPPDVEGAYTQDGRVWFVAANLPTEARARAVGRHEVFGHMAIERNDKFKARLDAIQRAIRAGNLKDLVREVRARQGLLPAAIEAREVVALMAERNLRSPLLGAMRSALREVGRDLGLEMPVDERELTALVAVAAKDLRRDAAIMRDYRAAAGLPAVQALQKADPSDQEILAALDAIYGDDDRLDGRYALLARPLTSEEVADRAEEALRPRREQQSDLFGDDTRARQEIADEQRRRDERRSPNRDVPADTGAPGDLFTKRRQEYLLSRAAALPGSVPNDIEQLLERVMAKPREALTIRDRLRELWRKLTDLGADSIRQGVIDSFDAIRRLEEGQFGAVLDAADSAYKAALATKNLPSVMAAIGLRGMVEYRDGAFQLVDGRKGIIEIFQPLTDSSEGNLLPLWELYAAAYRERDVMRTRKDYTPLFTDEERRQALALKDQYPVLEQVRADWETFNGQLLDLAAERGVLSANAVKQWKANFYVPFYREQEGVALEGPKAKRGLEGHGGQRVRKRLQGSEKPLGHVFENLLMNTAYLVDESFKNTAMQKIVAMAEPAGILVPAPEGARSGKDVVRVFENGVAKHYRVLDDLLLRSIGNMGYDAFADVFGLFRGSKRLLTSAITLDPAFMAANWVRDTLSAWVTSDAGIVPVIDSIKGAKAAFSMDSEMLAIMAAGGGGGGVYDLQPAELRKFLVEKLGSQAAANRFMGTIVSPKNWLRVWRKLGQAAENANRVAIYRAVRAAGGSVAEAAYQARDLLNFSMSGDYAAMRWLVATVPFMNARIQGLYRLWRGAKDHPGAFALKGLSLTAATLALLLANNDEEEYEQLPEWDKDMYWHFWLGGEHYRLPKPFEVGAIFGTIPERMYRLGSGRDSATIVKQRVMAMLGETFAFNPVPQVVKPLIEQYANRSFFTGSPIVGMAEANLAPEAQYTPWTPESLKLMAEALPDFAPQWLRSPQRLEAMVRGYLGATGMYALQAADVLAREASGAPPRPARKLYDVPVVKRFMQDPNPRYTKYADQLYTMLDEANAIFRTIGRYREQGRTEEALELIEEHRGKLGARIRLDRIASRVRALNNQMQLVLYSQSMSPEEKRERLDQLTATKNAITAQVAPLAEMF